MKVRLSQGDGRHGIVLPRWVVPFVWAVLVLAVQVFLPWAIARLGPAFGWSGATPGTLNYAGLIAVAAGLAMYVWCLAAHFADYPASVPVDLSPPILVVAGPYRFSRNPMYVSALVAWFGWAVFYGSPAVLLALALLWSVLAWRVIALEERQLEELFGGDYLDYKRTVRRWIGRA